MSEAASLDISVDQGTDFGIQIYWTDGANTPFTVMAPMRMDIKSETGQVIHSLMTGVADDEATPILYNSESGVIQLEIPADVTDSFASGSYDYDLFVTYQDSAVTNSTRLTRLLRGRVHVYRRVTQDV